MNNLKKIFLLTGLFLFLSQLVVSQEPSVITKNDIVGRWIEFQRIQGDSVQLISQNPDTYIFRDNMIFHKGSAAEGIIIFNITGKYTIEGDSIIVSYRDYMRRRATAQKSKELIFKVLSKSSNEMEVIVHDYDYEYKMILKNVDH